jgi:phosphonate transport system substrate-binding protein
MIKKFFADNPYGINYLIIVLFLLTAFIALPVACAHGGSPKKVSLAARTTREAVLSTPKTKSLLKFGFDLRLSPKEDVRIYLPLLKYLEQQTGHHFTIVFTANYDDTMRNLGTGVTQFASLGSVNCVRAREIYGAKCLVMGKNMAGKPEYQAAIVTRRDSPIRSIQELRGKSFAFGNRFSTQGYLIPRAMLEQVGIKLADLKEYTFTGSHDNTARMVLNGGYTAGAIQDVLAKKLATEKKIRMLALSKPYPTSLICCNRDVDAAIVKQVQRALLTFDPQGKQKKTLFDWDKTDMPAGFAPYDCASLRKVRTLLIHFGLLP